MLQYSSLCNQKTIDLNNKNIIRFSDKFVHFKNPVMNEELKSKL